MEKRKNEEVKRVAKNADESKKKERIKRNNINSISNNNNSIVNISRSNFINIIWARWNTK